MIEMHTTLNEIRANEPCRDGWARLLRHLGKTRSDDEPLPLLVILDSNGLSDALWCLRAVTGHNRALRLYAVWCATQAQHLMKDERSLASINVAERYADGRATSQELFDAMSAAGCVHRYDNLGDAAKVYAAKAATWVSAGGDDRAAYWSARDAADALSYEAAEKKVTGLVFASESAKAEQEAEFRKLVIFNGYR